MDIDTGKENNYLTFTRVLEMKLLIPLLLLSFNVHALDVIGQDETCILKDGSVIKNCAVFPGANGEKPNVYMKWDFSTTREDGSLFIPHDVIQTKIYFQDIVSNSWTTQVVKKAHTAAFMYKPEGTYATTMTTVSTNTINAESKPDSEIVITVAAVVVDPPPINPPDTLPQPPTIYFPLPAGNTAVITISPKVK